MSTEHLDRLLATATDHEASDMHLVVGVPAAYRVNGDIVLAEEPPLSSEEIQQITHALTNEAQRQKFEQDWELCLSLFHAQAGRMRVTLYRRNGTPELSFRFCGTEIPGREALGLPAQMDELAKKPNGLVLITGPTGAGKTTTMNYMVNLINQERRCKIVTIEDPIEFVHENRCAIVIQQEVLTGNRAPGDRHHALAQRQPGRGTDCRRVRREHPTAGHHAIGQLAAGDHRAGAAARH